MIVLLPIIPIIIVAIAVALIWYRMHSRSMPKGVKKARLSFRFRYIVLPVIILVICIITSAIFYGQLPAETAYHFQIDGTPDGWASSGVVVGIGLVIQLALVLAATGIVIAASRSGFLSNSEESIIKPENLLFFMGNLVAFPQLILCFTMIDIFSYNAYQKHLLPLWLFAIIILVIVTIAFLVLLVFYVIRANRQIKP